MSLVTAQGRLKCPSCEQPFDNTPEGGLICKTVGCIEQGVERTAQNFIEDAEKIEEEGRGGDVALEFLGDGLLTDKDSNPTERFGHGVENQGMLTKNLGSAKSKKVLHGIVHGVQNFDISQDTGRAALKREQVVLARLSAGVEHLNERQAMNLISKWNEQLGKLNHRPQFLADESYSLLGWEVRKALSAVGKQEPKMVREIVNGILEKDGYPSLDSLFARRRKILQVKV